jgi:hypothetical protein
MKYCFILNRVVMVTHFAKFHNKSINNKIYFLMFYISAHAYLSFRHQRFHVINRFATGRWRARL